MIFRYCSIVAAPAQRVFEWHERPEAIRDLAPGRPLVRIEDQAGGLHDGGRVTIAIGVGPLRFRWKARHFGYIRNEQFCDEQISGPFALWRHTHRIEPAGPGESVYEDRVELELPGGAVVNALAAPLMRAVLKKMFAHRHQIVRESVEQSS